MAARTGLIDRTVDQLRESVINGTWPVGSRIPTEADLASMLGVGRNTVREAVQSLVHSGLLVRRQGSGTYVLSDSELSVALGRQIEHVHQQHILEVRRSLEVEAARLAARRRTERDVMTLRSLNEGRQSSFAVGDVDSMVTSDLALHRAIVAAARNPLLLDLYENLLDAIGDSIRANVETDHPDHTHDELVEAIVDGDEDAAAREIYAYLELYLEALTS
ncbi:FadR family transcriptional regulator [Flavimobilis sp. GY10621]|uniref:FadR family transcriptional regulator n=1 Tax=Flavimobilis rhizosphaerae TaxID=2775421 RepID=A0ABR9DR49_9MICO|nr:FCD domain-containing protein [Flavimobilis rhizosphaerae]MBD9698455.1 FadR family transcriptional regulator [Flavimobilis rhizosphaerae]